MVFGYGELSRTERSRFPAHRLGQRRGPHHERDELLTGDITPRVEGSGSLAVGDVAGYQHGDVVIGVKNVGGIHVGAGQALGHIGELLTLVGFRYGISLGLDQHLGKVLAEHRFVRTEATVGISAHYAAPGQVVDGVVVGMGRRHVTEDNAVNPCGRAEGEHEHQAQGERQHQRRYQRRPYGARG